MEISNEILNQKIQETFLAYSKPAYNGTRSSKKLVPFHSYIAESIDTITNNQYTIHSLGYKDSKEKAVKGKYYDKNIDITISNNDVDLLAVEIKVINANYGKNGKNYFENNLGATANIKRNGIPLSQIIIIPSYVPCFAADGRLQRIEYLTSTRLNPYVKLDNDIIANLFHKADVTYIYIVDTNNKEFLEAHINQKLDKQKLSDSYNITTADINMLNVSDEIKQFLNKQQNFSAYISALKNIIELENYKRK